MGIESLASEELKDLGEIALKLSEFWKSENGDELRGVMSELTSQYMAEIMQGDPHAFRAVRAMNDLAKLLGDQELYVRAIRVEFERRFRNGGG